MRDGDVQSVLRCELCNKPFDKESTLKRHGYYCRSRRFGAATRSRSCISCAKSKARCDNKRPACSRCLAKRITCQYAANPSQGAWPIIQDDDDAPNKRQKLNNSFATNLTNTTSQEGSNEGVSVDDSALVISDIELESLGGDILDWFDPAIDFANLLDLPIYDKQDQYVPSQLPSSTRQSTPSTIPTIQLQTPIPSPSLWIPEVPFHNPRSLVQRPKVKTGSQRTSKLIFHTLKSYLSMVFRQNNLPPFVHASLLSFGGENSDMEPLVNCMSLMHMIKSGIQGSRKLFWKNVRLECERFCQEYQKLNKWELLAATQALSIYILVRMDEGETEYNNLDFLLIKSIIAKQLVSNRNGNMHSSLSASYNNSLESNWKAWIFEESIRRLCVIYQIVNMLVYFEPAAMCDLPSHLVLAPLPAKKQLWESGDEFAWQAENEKGSGLHSDFGLAANGELVKLEEERNHRQDTTDLVQVQKSSEDGSALSKPANWEEWCSGMDGLGGLVMLAASLIE